MQQRLFAIGVIVSVALSISFSVFLMMSFGEMADAPMSVLSSVSTRVALSTTPKTSPTPENQVGNEDHPMYVAEIITAAAVLFGITLVVALYLLITSGTKHRDD